MSLAGEGSAGASGNSLLWALARSEDDLWAKKTFFSPPMRLADAVRASTESMPYPSPEMGHPVSSFISIYMFPTGSEKAGLKPNIK